MLMAFVSKLRKKKKIQIDSFFLLNSYFKYEISPFLQKNDDMPCQIVFKESTIFSIY